MSQRKNYGIILLLSSLVLGIFLLVGSYFWMRDKADMILGVFVLILYGIGQWMTIFYWNRIQSDWESTGEVLGRMQQAVSDIPAALDANLKSIAVRLTEAQAQALNRLQTEVNEGARATLEKGSLLISESLDKNLRAPLASLETAMGAWQQNSNAQTEASRAFGEELRKAQREWSEKAGRMADSLSAELKQLAAAGAQSGEAAQAAWAERAAEVQSNWETKMESLQSRLLEEVVTRVEGLQAAQAGNQNRILDRALGGLEAQAKSAQEAAAGQTLLLQAAAADQGKAMQDAAAAFQDGLQRARESSQQLIRDLQEKVGADQAAMVEAVSQGQTRLVEEIAGLQRETLGEAAKSLEAQGRLGLEVAGTVSDLAEQLRRGSRDMAELAHVSIVNQTEMQGSVAMLNAGLSSILDRLEKQADAGDGYQTLLAELGRTLSSFQERAGEVLVENAMKTQEILMEVLGRQEGRAAQGGEDAQASETAMAAVN